MEVLLILAVPVVAFAVWAVVQDVRSRRRRDPLTDHDPYKAMMQARGESDRRSGQGGPGPGGP